MAVSGRCCVGYLRVAARLGPKPDFPARPRASARSGTGGRASPSWFPRQRRTLGSQPAARSDRMPLGPLHVRDGWRLRTALAVTAGRQHRPFTASDLLPATVGCRTVGAGINPGEYMKFLVRARSAEGESEWIEEFSSEERARQMLPRRGFQILEIRPATEADAEQIDRQDRAAKAAEKPDLSSIILTTSFFVAGREIEREVEVIAAECGYGMNIFRDFAAGVRDLVGGRSLAVQNVLRDARRMALQELRQEAFIVGADAVIGVDLDYQEMGNARMILLVASGTAVKLKSAEAA